MSTYLVAVVGLFDHIEDKTADGINVRAYCPIGKADQGKFALDVTVKTLDMYTERHFSMPYPLPKLDMAAVPYFSGCAKENFGLIIFCEIELLHHELHSGASCKQWFPEWNIWTQFLQQIAGGLHPNALEQSHPIKVHITQGD
ncbi:hypothetical protein VitviT2T_004859 [Vitis vinifera]|uniref:Peptidase M1 membrane alanine aminopeptidase domain-containing protein n=2 Tax=Vitis vinifera TaxID=29760 RepID=A0ABY9BS37_VITVI|nr:hypothetical protein VitviT2T_004859 [Vitis vinifera]